MRDPHPTRPSGQQTRGKILAAAEVVFSELGFTAARLEDVAARVGIRRASIVYYFRGKQELYDAVLESVCGDLLARFRAILSAPSPITERLEAAVAAWVSYVGERPSVARILLWESAVASAGARPRVAQYTGPVIAAATEAIRDGQRQGLFQPIDPIHFVFAVAGATIAFVSAKPTLAPDWPFDPFSPEQLETFCAEVLQIAKRLLGIPESLAGSSRKQAFAAGNRRGREKPPSRGAGA